MLDQAERARKIAEAEKQDAVDRCNECSVQIASLSAMKRKFESDLTAMRTDLDEACNVARGGEDRAKKSNADAQRAFEELKLEQEHGQQVCDVSR